MTSLGHFIATEQVFKEQKWRIKHQSKMRTIFISTKAELRQKIQPSGNQIFKKYSTVVKRSYQRNENGIRFNIIDKAFDVDQTDCLNDKTINEFGWIFARFGAALFFFLIRSNDNEDGDSAESKRNKSSSGKSNHFGLG